MSSFLFLLSSSLYSQNYSLNETPGFSIPKQIDNKTWVTGLMSGIPEFKASSDSESEEDIRAFHLHELKGALEFRFEKENNREKGFEGKLKLKQSRFDERINLQARGFFFHPNFIDYRLMTSLGFRQEYFRGDFKDKENTILDEYDLNLHFLRQKPLNLNFYANRSSITISRQFFESIKVNTNYVGGFFQYSNKLFPVSLFLQNQRMKEDSQDFKRERTERSFEFKTSNKLPDVLTSEFRYHYKNLIEEIPFKQEVTHHSFNLNQSIDYHQTHGNSSISYFKTSGLYPTDLFQINENFYIEHSKTFATLYHYYLTHYETEHFNSTNNRGEIGFRHKLYKSLETELKGEVNLTNATRFREFYYGPCFSLAYRKIVSGGLFSAGYNFLYRRVDRESGTGTVQVFDERIILSDGQRTFLFFPNVVLNSVTVRDVTGVLLTLNVDYRLIPTGNLTEIQRVGLPDNTPIVVDYTFLTPRSLTYDTLSNGLSLRYDFRNILSLYYQYLNTRHRERSDGPLLVKESLLGNIKKSLYGTELKWRWFNLLAEYEDDGSELIPFNVFRVRGYFNVSPTNFSVLSLSAGHDWTEYEKDRKTVKLGRLEAALKLRLNSFLDVQLGTGYLSERGQNLNTHALKFRAELNSVFRLSELKFQSEYLKRNEVTRDRNEFVIRLKFIRHFNLL